MDIIDSLKWRYATKKFDSRRLLSNKKLGLLYDALNLTPTSYGLQPFKIIVIRDKPLQKKLVALSYDQEQIAQASDIFVFCIINTIDETYITDYFNREKMLRGTSDDIINPFKEYLISSFKSKSESEIRNWAINQVYIALGNIMTVCAAEKIDACPIEGFLPTEYDKMLNLKSKGLQSILVLPVGYRAIGDEFAGLAKVRKPLHEVIHKID